MLFIIHDVVIILPKPYGTPFRVIVSILSFCRIVSSPGLLDDDVVDDNDDDDDGATEVQTNFYLTILYDDHQKSKIIPNNTSSRNSVRGVQRWI